MRMTAPVLRSFGVVLALLAASSASAVADQSNGRLRLRQMGTATRPTAISAPRGETRRVFVAEQTGRVVVLAGGRRTGTLLDLTGKVSPVGASPDDYSEQGLLGLAFAPDYATSRRLYVAYTRKADGALVVEEHLRSASNPDVAEGAPNRTVIGPIPHPGETNHNGGALAFGPDGRLYAGVGDGGGDGDPRGNAQNVAVQLGKILRYDVSGPTVVPAGSGIPGAAPGVWDYGLRNPWRLSFDSATGDLYIADVGQDRYEEIDVEPSGSGGARNWGWNACEGLHRYAPAGAPAPGECGLYQAPALELSHASSVCAIVGGRVVRDPSFAGSAADMRGRFVYGDWCGGWIASFRWAGGRATDVRREDGLVVSGLTTFGRDGADRIYVASGRGPVYRIEPVPGPGREAGPNPAARGAAVRLGSRVRLHKRRWVLLSVGCPRVNRLGCRGRVVLAYRRVRLGSATFGLRAGRTGRVRVRISRRGLRALRHRRRAGIRIEAATRDAAGRRRVARGSRLLRMR